MNTASVFGAVRAEFEGAEISDWRLRERLVSLGEALDEAPRSSVPGAAKTKAAREAAYRFLGNRKVTLPGIISPHVQATVRRCRDAGRVYAVADTTEFAFSGDRAATLGRLQKGRRGFLGHFAIAVSGDGQKTPLGVLGIETIARSATSKKHRNSTQRKKDPDRESLRWARMVRHSAGLLNDVPVVHVMDSEADIFELLSELTTNGHRFIIRSGQERTVDQGLLSTAVKSAKVLLERNVRLSRRTDKSPRPPTQSRRNPPRQGREARLEVAAMRVSLRRPKTCTSEHPETLDVNVVRVQEPSPPDDQQPVQWLLFTSEPVATADQLAAVVDGYRTRWMIEEYFKALKTGCAYDNSRQLESTRTLTNLLAILAVIAWRVLLLRTLERNAPDTPADVVLAPLLIEALAARLRDIREPKALPPDASVSDVFKGIARLGGHIESNGPPGWQVLWRGYQDLLTWGGGYIRAKSITSSDHS